MIKLIAALGNPGPDYAKTRHNAGWLALDAWSRAQGASAWTDERALPAHRCEVSLADRRVWLLKPTPFMNLSGPPVAALARFYKLSPEEILIVHDEVAFEPGQVKLSFGGSSGGHNGVESVLQALGTQSFWRLRLGIGRGAGVLSDWVLGPLTPAEIDTLQGPLVGDALTKIVKEGPETAQNGINRG